ncbi:MAG: bh protein [Actinobacteria bacterium]|nr:bh protein [Actinomycetota bacterium]
MKDEVTKITLFCINCNKETPHTVKYIGSFLRSVSCDVCTKKIEIDRRHLRTVFAEDFIDRILTKPHRITEDMKKAFATLTPFFPKRLFTEPLQALRDIYEVLKKDNGKKELNDKNTNSSAEDKDNKQAGNAEKN